MNIVTRQFMQLRRAAMNIGDEGMRLYLGCELHSSMDMVECLKKGRRLTLAGSRYVLVEFSNGDEKNYIEERVRSLLMNGFIPIIAHVERYKATRNDIGFLTELRIWEHISRSTQIPSAVRTDSGQKPLHGKS